MYKVVLALILCPIFVFGGKINIWSCEPGSVMPNWVAVDGCNHKACVIKEGSIINITAEFVPQRNGHLLMPNVRMEVFSGMISLPIAPQYTEACEYISACPVEAGKKHTLSKQIFDMKFPLKITTNIEFALYDREKQIICGRTRMTFH